MGMTFDGATKVITLTEGTIAVSVRDIWSRWVDWYLTSDNSKYLPAFINVGGDDIDESTGTKIPIYTFLVNGWRIKPQEANHTLTVSDGILVVDGGGDPFNDTDESYMVRVNYQQPVQAITIESGSGLSDEQNEKLNDVHDEALGKWVVSPSAKTLTLYRVDGVTILTTFDLAETSATVPVFIGRNPR